MSLDRFTNKKEILETKGPSLGLTWLEEDIGLLQLDEDAVVIDESGIAPLIEVHAYTPNSDYIVGGITDQFEIVQDKLYVNYQTAFNELELTRGVFKVVVNVHRELLGAPSAEESPLYIKEISPDRREVLITINVADSEEKQNIATDVAEYLEKFGRDSYSEITYDEGGNETGVVERPISQNISLNLGKNRIFKIVNQKEWGEQNEFVVRLYDKLPATINEKMPLWIVENVADSFTDDIDINVIPPQAKTNLLAGANFNIEDKYSTITETDFRNWNELLDTSTSSTQQIIDKIFSGSFGKGPSYEGPNNNETAPAVDFSGFQNFIHYSSAKERVVNFKYKLQLIEYYNTQLEILAAALGTDDGSLQGNISKNQRQKDNVIGGMDGFERWLYNEQTSSLFSHFNAYDRPGVNIRSNGGFIGASGYSLTPLPKYIDSNTTVLHHSTSSIAIDWYNGLYATASLYDTENNDQLLNSVPLHIQEDTNNSQYLMFIDMIAHHFDILYSYIKALTKVPVGEEHPELGVNKKLLYQAAQGMGWTLTNGNQASQLWQYALGKSGSGEYKSTGALFSKSDEDITTGVWRRIVNNLPYLLKTKGTARSIKALMNTYGIPQTLLSIREYGGPKVDGDTPTLIEDRFNYAIQFKGADTQADTATTGLVATTGPHIAWQEDYVSTVTASYGFQRNGLLATAKIPIQTHEYRFKPGVKSDMLLHTFGWNNTATDERGSGVIGIQYTASYSGSDEYGRINYSHGTATGQAMTASTDWVPLFNGQFWNLRHWFETTGSSYTSLADYNATSNASVRYKIQTQMASDYITDKVTHSTSCSITPTTSGHYLGWSTNNEIIQFALGGRPAQIGGNKNTSNIYRNYRNLNGESLTSNSGQITLPIMTFSGSIQEYRGWTEPLTQESFDYHTLNPTSYVSSLSPTGSYDTLVRHYPLGSDLNAYDLSGDNHYVTSSHPANHIKDFTDPIGSGTNTYASASNFLTPTNVQRGNFEAIEETYYVQGISLGGNNPRSQKIRLEENYLIRPLSPTNTGERSSFDYAPTDSNRLGLFYSMADQVNKDIFNHVGDVELDDYVGDPSHEFETSYVDLKRFSDNYWKKYSSKNDINAYMRIFSLYDFSLFNQIKQLLPARTDVAAGLLVEPNALERAKVKIYNQPVKSEPMFTASIQYMDIFENTNPRGDTLVSGSLVPISASIVGNLPSLAWNMVTHLTRSGYYAPEYTMNIPMTSSTDEDGNALSSVLTHDNNVFNGTVYKHISTLFPYKVAPAAAAALSLPYAITMSQHPLNTSFSGSVVYNQRPSLDGDRYPIKHYHPTRADFDKATNTLFRAVSESLNLPYSESLIVAPNRTEYANIANQNIYGCRLTAPGINIESNVPALGYKPIIEVFEVNANQLVYTSNVQLGNLDVR